MFPSFFLLYLVESDSSLEEEESVSLTLSISHNFDNFLSTNSLRYSNCLNSVSESSLSDGEDHLPFITLLACDFLDFITLLACDFLDFITVLASDFLDFITVLASDFLDGITLLASDFLDGITLLASDFLDGITLLASDFLDFITLLASYFLDFNFSPFSFCRLLCFSISSSLSLCFSFSNLCFFISASVDFKAAFS